MQVRGFSRLQWYVECNLLACRMQVSCRAHVSLCVQTTVVLQARVRSGEGLQDVLCSYERLWKKMSGEWSNTEPRESAAVLSPAGIPPTPESVCVELCVVLGMCQLLVTLSHWSLVLPYITTVVERGMREGTFTA